MPFKKDKKLSMYKPDMNHGPDMDHGPGMDHEGPGKIHGPSDYHDNKPASAGLKKLAEANPDKLKYVGKEPTMSGGGPHPKNMGYAEKYSASNFSDKTMKMVGKAPLYKHK